MAQASNTAPIPLVSRWKFALPSQHVNAVILQTNGNQGS